MTKVCISGGFDPAHIGHADLISEAAEYGRLIVILNSDAWLKRKKGYVFMPWEQRAKMLLMMKDVAEVVPVDDTDDTVCAALSRIKPDYFANGGDRNMNNVRELSLCHEFGIKALFNIGGEKQASSSEIVRRANGALHP